MEKQKTNSALLGKVKGEGTSVGSLVDGMGKSGYSKDDAVRSMIELQGKKIISLAEPRPYASLWSYAFSPNSLWFWATVAAVVASMALVTVTSGVVLYARYVLGSALVLFIPGYSLIEALYPKRELDELTRFALSIGLSLALVPLTGLVINYTPFGFRLVPVVISISGLTVALLLVSLYRKHQYYKLSRGVR